MAYICLKSEINKASKLCHGNKEGRQNEKIDLEGSESPCKGSKDRKIRDLIFVSLLLSISDEAIYASIQTI